jgi:hypothetical protein
MRKITADQNLRGALRFSRIPAEQKNGFLRCSVYLLNITSKPERLLSSLSNYLWNNPPPKSSRTPQEEPHFVTWANSYGNGAPEWSSCGLFPPRWSKLLWENPPPSRDPDLKCTRTETILKKFDRKINFKLKTNFQRDRMNFRSIQ